MNDKNKKSSAIFMPSGCLTGDALSLYVSGSLKGKELALAQQHLAECPLCSDAADGLLMWLNENQTAEGTIPEINDNSTDQPSETQSKQTLSRLHSSKPNGTDANKLHARTEAINDRIKLRLHTHAMHEAAENKRLSYKPFVWLAAAATIVLFIGGFYVIWIQRQFDRKMLSDNESVIENAPAQISDSSGNTLLPSGEKKPVLALKFVAPVVTTEDEIYENKNLDDENLSMDDLSSKTNAIALPEDVPSPNTQPLADIPSVIEEKATGVANAAESKNDKSMARKSASAEDYKEVFTIVEEMPSFPGGDAERLKFLSENIVYPPLSAENGIQGTVYVQFIVDTKGNITNAKILRGIGGGCDEEALRVINKMPPWHPGKQNGKYVRVLFNMPIIFKLQH